MGRATGGVFLYWMFPKTQQVPSQFQNAQKFNGTITLTSGNGQHNMEGVLIPINLPANPFPSNEVYTQTTSQDWNNFLQQLKKDMELAKQAKGNLIIIGDGSDGQTERERKLLANQRAIAFTAWLSQHGIGNFHELVNIITNNKKYEGISIQTENGKCEPISALRLN